MAKNNHYKGEPNSTPKKNKKKKSEYGWIVGVVAAVLVVVGTVTAAYFYTHPIASSRPQAPTHATVNSTGKLQCAIYYPDLQSTGAIWQTGGMEPSNCSTMREALETEFSDRFTIIFASDGTIEELGGLRAQDGNQFIIYRSTNRGREVLTNKPGEITLEDFATYEIIFADANGEQISTNPIK